MSFGLDLSIVACRAASALTSDPSIVAVGSEGWRATYAAPGVFDPVGDPRPLVVERPGYASTGLPSTVTDVLTVMSRVREPWPNDQTWTTDDVALSDMVYAGDAILGVANNSTQTYPKPQAVWLNHDREIAETATFTARLSVAHAHARKGRPVAAVRFTATDGVTTVETLVTAMSVTTYPTTGLSVPHFAGDLDFSALAPGALITVDAEIRPWVGPPFTVSTDADPYPSANLTVLKVLNDFDGGYGRAYAYLDPVAGNNGTAAVSADPVAARAMPYATLGAAVLAINQFNTAQYGRANLSGGVIRLEPGTTTHQGFGWYSVGEVPLIIEAADPAQKSATIYQDAGSSVSNGLPDMVKLRDLTLRRNGTANVIFLDSNATLGSLNMLVAERCSWDDNGMGANLKAWVYRPGRFWVIECDGVDVAQCKQFSTDYKACICIGSGAGSLQSYTYHAVGCRDLDAYVFDVPVTSNVHPRGGDFLGWNHMAQGVNARRCLNILRDIDDRGMAVIGNVFEHFGGTTGPVYAISADGVVLPAANLNVMCNTAIGSRTNLLYQDAGSAFVAKSGRCRFNVDWYWNSKDDAFLPQDSARTGNWAFQYRVGFRGNAALEGSNKGGYGAGDSWLGEVAALGDVAGTPGTPLVADWTDDQSFLGAANGGGDYRPGPAHTLTNIDPGWAPYPVDQLGSVLSDDGSAVAGALQP